MKKHILEEELYQPVRDYFTKLGFQVNGEVNHCDAVATKDGSIVVIELKRVLSMELMTQAVKRQKFADLVYMAVPRNDEDFQSSKWQDLFHLIRRLELGLIFVTLRDDVSFVEVAVDPVPFDRQKSIASGKKRRLQLIREVQGRMMDLNTGGSRSRKLMTAYREQALYVACILERIGEAGPKEISELGTDVKKTQSILKNNFYRWFDNPQRGRYRLSEKGAKEIDCYTELTQHYRNKVLINAEKIAEEAK